MPRLEIQKNDSVTSGAILSAPYHSKFARDCSMDFEWAETKARSNQRKHGVSFLEATEVFSDGYSSCVHDPDHSYNEERHLLFGVSLKGNYLVVSFT